MNEIVSPDTSEPDFTLSDEPFQLFAHWLADATKSEPNDPNAMALATVDHEGLPNVRMVLMKDFDHRGFVFYTNMQSRKGQELDVSGKAAAVFHWKSLRRQVRVRGTVEPVPDADADAYFASRSRASRIGAWASKQSRPLESRFALESAAAELTLKFGFGEVPRPPYWTGRRIVPVSIEFWRDGAFRLHDRVTFSRNASDAAWSKVRLYP